MHVLLISTYELGRQPFGIASPTAWLKRAGATVECLDLSIQRLDGEAVERADIVCFYVPMHTASRMAIRLTPRVRELNPDAHLCFYGLYASVNEKLFRSLGADTVIGGEFESGLVSMLRRIEQKQESVQSEPVVNLDRLSFIAPDRSGLPSLDQYASITLTDETTRVAGYTEATRGCKHLCRHCPVVPVYGGNFRVIPRPVVVSDIEQQVAAGAQHITFGDPDFLNGPGHALKIVDELHARWPDLTYDATIKIEHLLKNAESLPRLRETGCVLVTSAVEAIDQHILEIFDKHHTREDFERAVALCREAGLALNPTFVTFTPWTSLEIYQELLEVLATLDLVENVSPIQYAIRLLIPFGSRLLELPEAQAIVKPFDPLALVYPWDHPDPRVDALHQTVLEIVEAGQRNSETRTRIFERVYAATIASLGKSDGLDRKIRYPVDGYGLPAVPYLSEPWYC